MRGPFSGDESPVEYVFANFAPAVERSRVERPPRIEIDLERRRLYRPADRFENPSDHMRAGGSKKQPFHSRPSNLAADLKEGIDEALTNSVR
jgi:hypothetical protein